MPSSRRATFGQDVFENLKAMFEQAPAAPPEEKRTEYSKLELVRELAPTIGALAKRGWSWKSLAAMMTQRGVAISADLLKAYFAQSQGKPRRTRTNKKKATAKTPTAVPTWVGTPSAAAPNAVLEDASTWDETAPSPKSASPSPVRTTPPPPPRAVPVPPRVTTGTKHEAPRLPSSDGPPGSFYIRPDTPDL